MSAPCEIYIMRHGIATQLGHGTADDFKRKLTPDGRAKVEKIARGLSRLGVVFDWIVTSPLVRALETAQIILDACGGKVPMDVHDGLRPGEPSDALLNFLSKQPKRRRILLVGHEPDLSRFAARLLRTGESNLVLKKGGCCLIELDEISLQSQGRLIWWLTPRVLKAIGQGS
ncbi:MAG: phosphohistidine phosphatase SixA [Acidobacteria bacterium]|nr:phosphohistidine phosphatase SixA [Acidobacteriota bacterium]